MAKGLERFFHNTTATKGSVKKEEEKKGKTGDQKPAELIARWDNYFWGVIILKDEHGFNVEISLNDIQVRALCKYNLIDKRICDILLSQKGGENA